MGHEKKAGSAEILLIEDNPHDVELLLESMKESDVNNLITVVHTAEAALARLQSDEPDKVPGMIIMDLNLPGMNGIELLQALKADPKTRRIPVAVLTTSMKDDDVISAYDNYASCYITKPHTFAKMTEAAQLIKDFWFALATLPAETDSIRRQ